jgi:uncharacterized repeat protein (TIGR01451 family)
VATLNYNVVTVSADLAILQLAPRTVKTGTQLTYDALAVNYGPATADGVKIKSILPAGVTFVSAGFESFTCALFGGCSAVPQSSACSLVGNMVVCDGGQLKPLSLFSLTGVGVQIVVKVNAPANATLTETVSVESAATDPNPGNNTSTTQTSVRK